MHSGVLRGMSSLVAIVAVAMANNDDPHFETKMIEVKPNGGAKTETITNAAGHSCTFTYECTGGTGEAWQMQMHEKECMVFNDTPAGESYLYFSFFKLEAGGLEGLKLDQGSLVPHVSVHSPGEEEEFDYTENHMGIESNSKFNHMLSKTGIFWIKPNEHEDL